MDRTIVGLLIATIFAGAFAGANILYWIANHTINAINHLRRPR